MASKPTKPNQNGHNSAGSTPSIKRYFNQLPAKKRPATESGAQRNSHRSLPVCQYKETFLRTLKQSQAIVIVGETGSGKTTQIPKWCLELCSQSTASSGGTLAVACTQPRRIAAMSVANRVAQEMKVKLGEEVGYSVRFEACTSNKTRLKYLTDGMLLREAMLDHKLSSYGVIVLDEAHERTLPTEIAFGVIKRAMLLRQHLSSVDGDEAHLPPLKIVVMSATLDVKLFQNYLNAQVLTIEGRQHPVLDMFAEFNQSDLLTSTLITVFQIHRQEGEGDILVFCSGQDEIQSLIILTKKVLKQAPESLKNLAPLPLYASLPASHQMRVFDYNKTPSHTNGYGSSETSPHTTVNRRVIYATNVAETSVTIPNIKYVVDTGKVKCRTFCPLTGLESLKVATISKAQARQRSGRAGRVAPGTCYRLYTEEEHHKMEDHLLPEIKRCNLDSVFLQMFSSGVRCIDSFPFLEKPEDARIKASISNLLNLKAIKTVQEVSNDSNLKNMCDSASTSNGTTKNATPRKAADSVSTHELTNLGKKLSSFPLDPSMSCIILAANELGCLDEALTVVSLLSVENLFHIPPNKASQAEAMLEKFRSNEGDPIMLLKVYKAFKRTSALNKPNVKQWCQEHFIHIKNLKLAQLIRKQLFGLCKGHGMSPSSCNQDTSSLRRALTYGLLNNVATMWNGKYRNKSCDDIHIHPSSCLFKSRPDCILYLEIVETNKRYMRHCTLIEPRWINEISSNNLSLH